MSKSNQSLVFKKIGSDEMCKYTLLAVNNNTELHNGFTEVHRVRIVKD